MSDHNKICIKKHIILSSVGIGVQIVGGIFLCAATLGIAKEINTQIKKTIIHELSKQISAE